MVNQEHVDEHKAEQPDETPSEAQPATEESPGEDVTQLLEDARAKADEHWNMLLRTQAELENLRKRAARDLENAHKFALEKFATELLAVRDSLEMGIDAAQAETDPVKLKEGSELTLKMLAQVMEKFDIEQIDPAGEKFDPELHQAMTAQENAEVEPNTVIAVMQKGYRLSGRLIRPAMVMVSKAPSGG